MKNLFFLSFFLSVNILFSQSVSPQGLQGSRIPDFIEIIPLGTQTTVEATRYQNLVSNTNVHSINPISLNLIQNYLNGNTLTINHPLTGIPLTFKADNVIHHNTTTDISMEYFWSGTCFGGDNSNALKGYISLTKKEDIITGQIETYNPVTNIKEYLRITTLDSYKPYIIKLNPDGPWIGETGSVKTGVCGGALNPITHELDPIYDETYSEVRCSGDEGGAVNVLFLVVDDSDNIFNPRDIAFGMIDQMNGACMASGAKASFRLAGVDEIANASFNQTISTDEPIEDDGIGQLLQLSIFNQKRDLYNADITIVLLASPYFPASMPTSSILGVAAALPASSNNDNYAFVNIGSTLTRFTGIHELGHLLGARHQRCEICMSNCDDDTKHHGFIIGGTSNTIMSVLACAPARVPRYSSQTALLGGLPTGDNLNRNADIIEKCSKRAACLEIGPNANVGTPILIPIGISGSSSIPECVNSKTWTASPAYSGFSIPTTYTWQYSANGLGNWITIGSQQSLTINNLTTYPISFVLRVTVTDLQNHYGQAVYLVNRDIPCIKDIDAESRNKAEADPGIIETNYYDIQGRKILKFTDNIQNSILPTGFYIIQNTYQNGKITSKLIYKN